jgi:hypothetical protein
MANAFHGPPLAMVDRGIMSRAFVPCCSPGPELAHLHRIRGSGLALIAAVPDFVGGAFSSSRLLLCHIVLLSLCNLGQGLGCLRYIFVYLLRLLRGSPFSEALVHDFLALA